VCNERNRYRMIVGDEVDRGGVVSKRYKTVADIKKLSI
jgi:hypothetical protein